MNNCSFGFILFIGLANSFRKSLYFALTLFMLTFVTTLFAQNMPKVGDLITGIVFDESGPMGLVKVQEVDSTCKEVAYDITDTSGRFMFYLKNDSDSIRVNCVGYNPVIVPIAVNCHREVIKLHAAVGVKSFLVVQNDAESLHHESDKPHPNTGSIFKEDISQSEDCGDDVEPVFCDEFHIFRI